MLGLDDVQFSYNIQKPWREMSLGVVENKAWSHLETHRLLPISADGGRKLSICGLTVLRNRSVQ